ncbi:V-type ATP synthase subunit F [Patescibacteria group bacterium]|nr:V-type ATP synthase subunit F [Patescibacteria group bacterium]MBU1682709.1 V-type ATP synthase subunit F [Patescibacteria group bacterium]MBU1935355.1 V-type ATP synthase subunit F [Patescibacteria group bacterium]
MGNYKIAIIGSRETILGFKALGLEPVYATNSSEAVESMFSLKREKMGAEGESRNKYAILFVMEDLMMDVTPDDYKKLTADPLPAIIPLPSHLGSTGYGLKKLKGIVERAVGMDILN